MKRYLLVLFAIVALLAAGFSAACGDDDNGGSATATSSASAAATTAAVTASPTPLTGDITVFAASSLIGAFTQIGKDFDAAHAGVHVTFNFAGSQDLRTQLEQGADADVFASADTTQMANAKTSNVVTGNEPIFVHNRLVIIVPNANPANITTPRDLANPGVKLILAGATVPVGKYARLFLDAATADTATYGTGYKDAVLANVISEATNVKEVISPVQLNEADAGIVYTTDAKIVSLDVKTIDIPDAVNQIANYPISLTTAAASNATAQGFIDYVLSSAGQTTLASFGFIKAS